ncbi:sulfurtransferase TusA family protein [Thermoflexus sp.]|uniref:sulfurtransferase TusA family protein n=1 Tax=Thermoflexus sp. TaxID=1969742 RepID=UPI0035E405E5
MRIVQTVDLRAPIELCTESPIGRIQQALAGLGPGEAVAVRVRGYADEFTVTAWAKRNGYTVVEVQQEGEETRIVLAARSGSAG